MQFKAKGKVEKIIYTDDVKSRYLCKIKEQNGERIKFWSVWCNTSPNIGSEYEFTGYVTESKIENMKDPKGYDMYKTNFNAQSVTAADEMNF